MTRARVAASILEFRSKRAQAKACHHRGIARLHVELANRAGFADSFLDEKFQAKRFAFHDLNPPVMPRNCISRSTDLSGSYLWIQASIKARSPELNESNHALNV